jgi:urease accessory protein
LAESQQLAFSLNAWIKDVLKMPVEVKKQFGLCLSMHSFVGV